MLHSYFRLAGGALMAIVAVGCSGDPVTPPSPPPSEFTHPSGDIVAPVALDARPYGVAIVGDSVAHVARLDAQAVSGVKMASGAVLGSVAVGQVPTDVFFASQDGGRVYVTNQFSPSLGVYRPGQAATSVPVLGNPFRVTANPAGTRVYVSSNDDGVHVYDAAKLVSDPGAAFLVRISACLDPNGFAWSPNATTLYASCQSDGQIAEINVATNTVTRLLPVGGQPQDIVVSPSGTELYVANQASGLQIWNLATNSELTRIVIQAGAFGLAMTRDTEQLWVAETLGGRVLIINRATRAIVKTLPLGGLPRRIVFNAFGDVAAVTNEAGSVAIVR
jgi:DNA-binding beta-propeller fold protein YncE